MSDIHIVLPSKPRIVSEEEFKGVYEIDGLYPGYGHTLGNSLRRIILSSLPGAAVTSVKINGVSHEFSVIDGIKEDVITIIQNIKKIAFKMHSNEIFTVNLKAKGEGVITAGNIEAPSQIEIMNPELIIATATTKSVALDIEMVVEQGLGFVPRDIHQKDRVEIGTISLDAIFTPIRRVSYEVENMRVGDRTDFNRLRISIETSGAMTPHDALQKSIQTMIEQLRAIVGFEESEPVVAEVKDKKSDSKKETAEVDKEFLKTRIETLDLSARTKNALTNANIRTVGGLARKKEADLLELDGLGDKGIQEIRKAISNFGLILKEE